MKRTTLVVIAFGLLVGGCQTCAGGDDNAQQQQQQSAPNAPAKSGSPRHIRAPLMGVTHADGAAAQPAADAPDAAAAP